MTATALPDPPAGPLPVGTVVADPASVDAALLSRQSVRAFRPDPVPQAVLEQILAVAARAGSGSNTQPWKVYVLQGASRDRLVDTVCALHDAIAADPALGETYRPAYDYYAEQWFSPYLDRRRQNGWSLYGLLGIGRGDKEAMHAQHGRNFRFFDAPVGLIFTVDRALGRGALLDYGMFLQSIMLAARARGLHTCPQAAWNRFETVVLPQVGAGDHEMLVCGMALGHADGDAPVNTLRTPRETVADFTRWLG